MPEKRLARAMEVLAYESTNPHGYVPARLEQQLELARAEVADAEAWLAMTPEERRRQDEEWNEWYSRASRSKASMRRD